MNTNHFNSSSTFLDVINSGIDTNTNIISFIQKNLTERINGLFTVDEIFMLIIGTLASLSILMKHHSMIYHFINNKMPEDVSENINELNYTSYVLQNIFMVAYTFYIANMIFNNKNHVVISRYSMLLHYLVSITILSINLYKLNQIK